MTVRLTEPNEKTAVLAEKNEWRVRGVGEFEGLSVEILPSSITHPYIDISIKNVPIETIYLIEKHLHGYLLDVQTMPNKNGILPWLYRGSQSLLMSLRQAIEDFIRVKPGWNSYNPD
jgi:hypothetical protein